jgi:hypothetical protein
MSFFQSLLMSNQAPVLFLNAGQSNDEKGILLTNVDLTAPYQVPFPQVQYWGDDSAFHTLDHTVQGSYQSPILVGTLNYSNQFYLYPQLANALGRTLYVCSHSVGDTNLSTDWKSTATVGALYTAMISRINACIAALTLMYGRAPTIFCFLWDQGEKDGRISGDASAYETNEINLFDNIRTAIGYPALRFFVPLIKLASINGSPNPVQLGETINDSKKAHATLDGNIITQDTNYFEPSTDGVHFTVLGQSEKNDGQIQAFIDAGWLPGTVSPSPPSGQTYFNGYGAYVRFGDILDTTFSALNSAFRLGITLWNPPLYSARTLVSKFTTTSSQRTFHWLINGSNITFNYYLTVGDGTRTRGVTWTGLTSLYDGNEHTLEVRYDGSINTNDGLDRCNLYLDGVLYTTGKTLSATIGAISNTLFSSSAQLAVGAVVNSAGTMSSTAFVIGGWAKDFLVKDGAGTVLINVPNLATGTDTSGNGRNGTFVS